MGTNYEVAIEYTSKGDFGSKLGPMSEGLGRAHTGATKLQDALAGIGSKAMSAFDSVASKVASVAVGLGQLGIAAGGGAIAYGVGKLNNDLEKTQTSLAAIFTANGLSNNMAKGLELGADAMAQMRKDAAALPGELSDLTSIFKTAAIPGFQAGASIDQLRELSAKTMAFGAVSGLPMDQTGREMAMLLEGRAGAHNVLGMRLGGLGGSKAEEFNAKGAAERFAYISTELNKYSGAIETYKHSFEGLSSTFIDNAKRFLGNATAPLFDNIRNALEHANEWFEKNETTVNVWASNIGSKLSYAFEWGSKKLEEWGPIFAEFADNAGPKILAAFKAAEPLASALADAMKGFLKDPEALDKIKTIAEIYAAAKGGQMAVGAAQTGMSLFGATGLGAGAAGGAGVGAGGVAAFGTAALSAAVTLGWIVAAGASLYAAYDQWTQLVPEWIQYQNADSDARVDAGKRIVAAMQDEIDYRNTEYQKNLQKEIEAGDSLVDYFDNTLGASLIMLNATVEETTRLFGALDEVLRSKSNEKNITRPALDSLAWGTMGANSKLLQGTNGGNTAESKSKHPGGGGTNIQKVEIVVTSNQNPSRIARMVLDEMQNIQRHPKVSRGAPNWSAARG